MDAGSARFRYSRRGRGRYGGVKPEITTLGAVIANRSGVLHYFETRKVFEMRLITVTAFIIIGLFLTACNSGQQQQTAIAPENEANPTFEDYWAKDNFDLQRAGDLLEKSDSPEEFERYLNDDDYGVNNLDLNDDGYADYISVEEFDDRDDNTRGLSLFSRFGPSIGQEIAQIFFYRDRPDYPGARIYLRGDDRIYGDNAYYETNWLDRSLQIASFLFGGHDPYRSPYYYDNYPSWYSPYEIVETPVYRTRLVELYPQPLFVYTNGVPVYFEKIKIKSPNNGLHLGQIKARLAKPTKEQMDFYKNNPRKYIAKAGDKPGRDNPPRSDRGDERGNPGRDERGAQRGNPDKPDVGNPNKGGNPNKPDVGNPNKGGGNPNKPDVGNPNKGGGNPNKPDAGNPNKGGGNPNKPAGGNPNKGGGGGKKP